MQNSSNRANSCTLSISRLPSPWRLAFHPSRPISQPLGLRTSLIVAILAQGPPAQEGPSGSRRQRSWPECWWRNSLSFIGHLVIPITRSNLSRCRPLDSASSLVASDLSLPILDSVNSRAAQLWILTLAGRFKDTDSHQVHTTDWLSCIRSCFRCSFSGWEDHLADKHFSVEEQPELRVLLFVPRVKRGIKVLLFGRRSV